MSEDEPMEVSLYIEELARSIIFLSVVIETSQCGESS